MKNEEMLHFLDELIAKGETECIEFKEANDNFSTSEIGKYFSALANEANLNNLNQSWLAFGVQNKSRTVVGSTYRTERKRLDSLKQQIADGTSPPTSFRDIYEVNHPSGRVLLFEISAAPRGTPISWNGHYYARNGESLTALSLSKLDEIRKQGREEDWSAGIVDRATLDDLDPDAIKKAREVFSRKNKDRIPESTIAAWNIEIFLDHAKLTRAGKITRTALLLVGREEVTTLLNPFVAELSWKLEGPESAYEHFHPPFLLTTSQLFRKIRNNRISLMPPGQLIPLDIQKYDERIILEALHNCIAHQDYTLCERIVVIERLNELEFQSAGEFYDGKPEDYIAGNRLPRHYRNRFLIEAMVNLRMIDTIGIGIREVLWKMQANRFFPLPDYDLSDPNHVTLRIPGNVIDQNYTRVLQTHPNLPWQDILDLDRVQKKQPLDNTRIRALRRHGLIEGRQPNLRVTASIAQATESQTEYIRHRAFDDAYFCDLILGYLQEFQSGKRSDFERLLAKKLSDSLSLSQKSTKVDNLIQRLRKEGKIQKIGQTRGSVWSLATPKASDTRIT